MVLERHRLSDRDLNFKLHRLNYLDQEITRYRDYEWKATTIHTAFFVAILYILIDPARRPYITQTINLILLGWVIFGYFFVACAQLLYIHIKLNSKRNDRTALLEEIGESGEPRITEFCGFYEGKGVIFILSFIIWLIFLVFTDLFLLFHC